MTSFLKTRPNVGRLSNALRHWLPGGSIETFRVMERQHQEQERIIEQQARIIEMAGDAVRAVRRRIEGAVPEAYPPVRLGADAEADEMLQVKLVRISLNRDNFSMNVAIPRMIAEEAHDGGEEYARGEIAVAARRIAMKYAESLIPTIERAGQAALGLHPGPGRKMEDPVLAGQKLRRGAVLSFDRCPQCAANFRASAPGRCENCGWVHP